MAYCILYPDTTIIVVAPTRGQSTRFIKKIQDFARVSPNLRLEINDKKTKFGMNESVIEFNGGSKIITMVYSENALGQRGQILVVDEFVRTEKEVIIRVFVPMLTSPRKPPYVDLTKAERDALPEEANKQLYLSSIRGADEWSYDYFLEYIDDMTNPRDNTHFTVALPYNIGVKNGYISKNIVEQSFKENQENLDLLLAEYTVQPERSTGDAFYKYNALSECRQESRPMVCMSDAQYIQYKNDKTKFPFWVEKLPKEIRLLGMDVALVESKSNDNTAFWVLRLIPEGNHYIKKFQYCETMNGINSLIQCLRAKQLFYEMDCDYFVIDSNGNGQGIFDIATTATEDYARGETYPAWTALDPEDTKSIHRAIDPNAVPVVECVKTSLADKSRMLLYSRDAISLGDITLLVDTQDGIDYLNQNFEFYKIDDMEYRGRILQAYAQTSAFISEAINLKQVTVQGRISAVEKAGKRKDRVMSLVYTLDFAKQLEDELTETKTTSLLDWVFFG